MKGSDYMLRTICLRLALVCLALIFFTMPAHAKTILYVPMDDRPVNYNYPADTVTAAGIQIIMPPAEFVGGRGREGLPDKVWEWTLDNASRADALVLSADALLYGGLVDSRTHGHGKYSLEWRAMGFEMLKKARPDTPIYLFSTDSPLRSMRGDFEAMALYAGQGVERIAAVEPAARRLQRILAEAQALWPVVAATAAPAIELASPVCYAAEFERERNAPVLARLNELLQAERAGVRVFIAGLKPDMQRLLEAHELHAPQGHVGRLRLEGCHEVATLLRGAHAKRECLDSEALAFPIYRGRRQPHR